MKQTLLTRGRALTVAIVLAAGTAGCSANSPYQTAETQSIADGVAVDLDGAQVRNLVLISNEKGGNATVTGTVESVFELPLTSFSDGGWYWFDLIASTEDLVLESGDWSTDAAPVTARR